MGVSCGNPLESGNVATQNSCPHILLFLFYLLLFTLGEVTFARKYNEKY